MSHNNNSRSPSPIPKDPSVYPSGPWARAALEERDNYLSHNVFEGEDTIYENDILLEHKWVCDYKNGKPSAKLYFHDPTESKDDQLWDIKYLPQARINTVLALAATQGLDVISCKIDNPYFYCNPLFSYVVKTPKILEEVFQTPYLRAMRTLPGLTESAHLFQDSLSSIFRDELGLICHKTEPSFFTSGHSEFCAIHLNSILIVGKNDFVERVQECLVENFDDYDVKTSLTFIKHEITINAEFDPYLTNIRQHRLPTYNVNKYYDETDKSGFSVLTITRNEQADEFMSNYRNDYAHYMNFINSNNESMSEFVTFISKNDLSDFNVRNNLDNLINTAIIAKWGNLFSQDRFDTSLFGKVNYLVNKQYPHLQFAVSVLNLGKKASTLLANYMLHSLARDIFKYKSEFEYFKFKRRREHIELCAYSYPLVTNKPNFFAGIAITLDDSYIYSTTYKENKPGNSADYVDITAAAETCEAARNTINFLHSLRYEVNFKVFVEADILEKIAKMEYGIPFDIDEECLAKLQYLVEFKRATGAKFCVCDKEENKARVYANYLIVENSYHRGIIDSSFYLKVINRD